MILKRAIVTTILSIFLCMGHLLAQVSVELKVKQSVGAWAKLLRYAGKDLHAVDSCRSSSDGVYRFTLPQNASQGLYRMALGKTSSFDFIVANEPEIKFESVVFALEDSLRAIMSKENKVFIQYVKLKRTVEQQLWMLGSLQNYYSADQPFAQQLREEKQRVEHDFSRQATALASLDTALFVSNYINLDTKPFVLDAYSECSYKAQLASDWWCGVDLSDDRLLNTPLLIKNVWEFLEQSICDDTYDKEQQDSVFVAQLGVLFKKSMSNLVRNQVIGSLCRGFMDTDYLGVLNYLLSHGGEAASVLRDDSEFMARLVLEKSIAVGSKAYDFKVKPSSGKSFKLSAHKSSYRLIVFWSIWCPHCVEMMPSLVSIHKEYCDKGLEIVAIAIDDERELWEKFIADKRFPWIDMLLGADYDNPVILRYNVDETPKMFLLNKNLEVVSRPSSPEQLRLKLRKLL